jgi:hypothetical protein
VKYVTLDLAHISKAPQYPPKKQYIRTVKMIFFASNVRIGTIPDEPDLTDVNRPSTERPSLAGIGI